MFYKNYISILAVNIVACALKSMCVPCFILIGYCVSELHSHIHICPYRNVWPEAIYCCFTRTTLFTELFTCLYDQSLRLISLHQVSLLYSWFLLNVLPEDVYCYFTRFTTMFTIFDVFIEKYVCTKFHVNWLLCE